MESVCVHCQVCCLFAIDWIAFMENIVPRYILYVIDGIYTHICSFTEYRDVIYISSIYTYMLHCYNYVCVYEFLIKGFIAFPTKWISQKDLSTNHLKVKNMLTVEFVMDNFFPSVQNSMLLKNSFAISDKSYIKRYII